jgi:hypothetical protein
MKREDIPRCPVPDDRSGQTGCGHDHIDSQADRLSNPSGHNVDSESPCDTDPMNCYKVPDCAYKGYDSFTWPEGKASPADLPHGGHQPDDIEEFKPKR